MTLWNTPRRLLHEVRPLAISKPWARIQNCEFLLLSKLQQFVARSVHPRVKPACRMRIEVASHHDSSARWQCLQERAKLGQNFTNLSRHAGIDKHDQDAAQPHRHH